MSGESRWRPPQRLAQQRRCRWHYADDDACLDRRFMLRQRRVPHGLVLALTAAIVAVMFALGAILNQAAVDDRLFGLGPPSSGELTNAYNDRAGREVAPHARWQRRGHRWQSPHPDLKLFAAHYRHELGSLSKPSIRVTALATAAFLGSCSVRARVVYRDYPHSFPSEPVFCRPLFRSPAEGANATLLFDVILKFATGQPANRVPVAVSIQAGPNRSSVAWIAVNAVLVEPRGRGDSVAVCMRVHHGADLKRVAQLVASYRHQGAQQITAYASAEDRGLAAKPSFRAQLVLPWYDRQALREVADKASLSLMLRDCALRSSPRTRCLALLSSNEKLVFSRAGHTAKDFFKDEYLLNLCGDAEVVRVKRRDFFYGSGSCSLSLGSSTRLQRCVGGPSPRAVFFRIDEALLDGTLSTRKSGLLPSRLAFLRPLSLRDTFVGGSNETTPDTIF